MPFGIPEIEEAFAELDKSVNAGAGDLTAIGMQIVQALDTAVAQSTKDVGKIKSAKERIFNRIDAASKQDLQTIADGIGQALAITGDASNAELGAVAAAGGAVLQERFQHPFTQQPPPIGQPIQPPPAQLPPPAPPPIGLPVPPTKVIFGPPPVEQQPQPIPIGPQPPGQPVIISPWWCHKVFDPTTGGDKVCAIQADDPGVLGDTIVSGPYATREQAQAVCLCVDAGLPPPAPLPIQPPPVQQPPPEQQPPTVRYGCFQSQLDGSYQVFQLGTNTPDFLWDGVTYDSFDAASNTCGQQPSPTPPTEAQCRLLNLPSPPAFGGFTYVGTDQFCGQLDKLAQTLGTIGMSVYEWIINGIEPDSIVAKLDEVPAEGGPLELWTNLKHYLTILENMLKCGSKSALQLLKDALGWLRSSASSLAPQGTGWVVGIWVLKTLVRSLENVRAGWDLAVWLTFDIHVEFKGFVQLLDYLSNYVVQMEIPSIGDTIEGYLKGSIPEDIARCWVQMRDGNWDVWTRIINARRERLTRDELIQYGRRQGWTDDRIKAAMAAIGWIEPVEASAAVELYWEIPTINDHLGWLRRNVDDLEYVQKYNLLDGFSTDEVIRTIPGFETYTTNTDTHGRDFWKLYGGDLTARGLRVKYAANHYAAHWIQPSPEQMRQFVFRLRPGAVPDNLTFTSADFKRILAEQDYAPLAREWFAATINPVPAISYVKQMFQLGAIDAARIKAYHMDLGYKESDADNFVSVDKVQRARHLASSGHGFTPAAMANAYAIGEMTEDEIRSRMQEQGYPNEISTDLLRRSKIDLQRIIVTRARSRSLTHLLTQVKNAVSVGVMSVPQAVETLVSAGWPNDYAIGLARLEEASANTALVKEAIAKLKRAFLAGEIDAQYVGNSMRSLGITQEAATRYGVAWEMMNTPGRKRRTAAQITNDVANNAISTEEAIVRLRNLGYDDADRRLFMADAQRKVHGMEQKANAAELKAGRQKATDLAKQIRQADSIRRRLLSDLKRMEPVPHLQKWLKAGIITREYFDARMALYGYAQGEIQAYAEEKVSPGNGKGKGAPGQPGSP